MRFYVLTLLFILISITSFAADKKKISNEEFHQLHEKDQLTYAAMLRSNEQIAQGMIGGRVWYIGMALGEDSTGFEADVQLVQKRLTEINSNVVSYRFSNYLPKSANNFPIAGRQSLATLIEHIKPMTRPNDTFVILLTAHGNRNFLAATLGGVSQQNISTYQISQALKKIENIPTALIISACYSGSHMAELKHENRIILTASDVDKTSWGCSPDSKNTWFIKSMFNTAWSSEKSLRSWIAGGIDEVKRTESMMNVRASNPLFSIGSALSSAENLSLRSWLNSRTANQAQAK